MLRLLCFLIPVLFASFNRPEEPLESAAFTEPSEIETVPLMSEAEIQYERFGLDQRLPFEAFEQAFMGYQAVGDKRKEILTIIDFTKPSTEERMFVLDMDKGTVLFETIVSHGRNSGDKYAKSFSNTHGSYQSSLGFYLTAGTYMGGNGYSLILDGLEKGINDQARSRAVVIHGADYCSKDFIRRTGRLGRSYGCPALPRAVNQAIIDTIKNGSLLYIYAQNERYASTSRVLKEAASMETASVAGTGRF